MEIQYDLYWQELVLVQNYANGNNWFDFEMQEKFIKYQQLFMDFSQNTMNKYTLARLLTRRAVSG